MSITGKYTATVLALAAMMLSGCGVKTYKPERNLQNPGWVKIDGSESRNGIPFIGSKYFTFVHLWRWYPDTCEAYYHGAIKAKRSKTSRKFAIPSNENLKLHVVRSRVRSGYGGGYNRTVTNTSSFSRDMFLVPKPGHGYLVRVNDLDRQLYDFTLTEVSDTGTTELPYIGETDPESACPNGLTRIKRAR